MLSPTFLHLTSHTAQLRGLHTQRRQPKFAFCPCSTLLVQYCYPTPHILLPANQSCDPSAGAPDHGPHSPAPERPILLPKDTSTKEKGSKSIRHSMPRRDRRWDLAPAGRLSEDSPEGRSKRRGARDSGGRQFPRLFAGCLEFAGANLGRLLSWARPASVQEDLLALWLGTLCHRSPMGPEAERWAHWERVLRDRHRKG